MSFRVLHVCTGNLCRSPVAEHLMRAGLVARLGDGAERFVVESAGTWGRAGAPMPPLALRSLTDAGVDGSQFRARELVIEHVAAADLVLGATREHRAGALVLVPRQSQRTFTLLEFARLVAAVDPAQLPEGGDQEERAREVVRLAAAKRGMVRAARPADDDIPDPYKGPERGYVEAAEIIEQAVTTIVERLTG